MLLMLASIPALAGTPEWVRMAARSELPKIEEDTPAVALLDETSISISAGGEEKEVIRRVYKILTPKGQDYGNIRVYFDSETRLDYLRAWSMSPQGSEYEIKDKDKGMVETAVLSEALYDDMRVRNVRIPASLPGSVIAYEYARASRPRVLQSIWNFQHEIPSKMARLVLELPPNWEFETHWRNYQPIQAIPGAGRRACWELHDVAGLVQEDSMPPWRTLAASLGLTFHPAGATRGSWQEVGSWYTGLAAERLQPTAEIKAKVTALLSTPTLGLPDKLRAITKFVQQDVRYVAIEIGRGTLQPHFAGEVFRNLYGDCKDKATLLVVMLRAAGFDSYYALVNTDRGAVDPDFPSVLAFDHVIVAIRLPKGGVSSENLYALQDHPTLGQLLYFDPTSYFTPLGYLPSLLQGGDALLITPGGGELVQLPLSEANVNRFIRDAKLTLAGDGSLSGTMREIHSGSIGIIRKASWAQITELERKRQLEDFVSSWLGHVVVSSPKIDGLEDSTANLVVDYAIAVPNYGQVAGPLLLFRPRVLGSDASDVLEKKKRNNPLEFANRFAYTDMFEIHTPSGYVVDELPSALNISSSIAEYRSNFETEAGLVRYTRTLTIKQPRVSSDDLDKMRDLYRQIAAEEGATVVLRKATR